MPRHDRRPGLRLLGYVGLGAVCALMLLPFLYMLSIASGTGNQTGLLPGRFALLGNIHTVVTSAGFGRFLLNSVIMSGGIAVLDVLISGCAGYALGTLQFPGKRVLFGAVIAILGVSQSWWVIPVYVMLRDVGWLNSYQGLIVPLMCSAFGVFLVRQFALGIPGSVIQAARLDGASELRILAKVAVPFLRPALLTLLLLDFLAQWDNLIWPLVVASQSSLWTVAVGLSSFQGEHGIVYNLMAAAGLVSMIPPFLLFLLLQRNYVRGVTFGGIDR